MASKSSARAVRIAAQMQRALSGLLRRGVKDPRVGNVTVTAVELAPDLSVARVHFLPFASTQPPTEVMAGLRSAAGYLRGEVARELQLRHAPRLEFELDTQIERAVHLTQLIDQAVNADRAREDGRAHEDEQGREDEQPRERPVAPTDSATDAEE